MWRKFCNVAQIKKYRVEKMKIAKKKYIIGSGISVLLLAFIVIIVIFVIRSAVDNPSTDPSTTDPNEIPLPYTNALVVKIDNSTLWARDIDSDNSMYLIKNWTTTFQSFDFYRKKNIYFGSTVAGQDITSYSRQFFDLAQPGAWYANKIAVDYVHEKVYVLDGLAEKINVFDIRNAYYNVISIDLYQPEDIAVDPIQRCLFILQMSSILKTNLDGSLSKIIIESKDITAFQIDVDEKRIYWVTKHDIQSVDYAGRNLIAVKRINKAVISLAVSHNNLFWLNPSSHYEKSALWFCKIVNGVCESTSSTVFGDNAVEIKVYNFDKLQVSNPCDSMRDCEHMCINSNNKPRCVCNIGWQLKNDSQHCEAIDEFLLYVQGEFVKGRLLDFSKDTLTAALLPIKLNVQSNFRALHFDFNVRSREFIFSDDYSINKINLKPGSRQTLIGGDSKDIKINPVTDWITGNIYHVRSIYWEFFSIVVHNIEPYDHSKADCVIWSIRGSKVPKSLVIHPNRGFLFVALLGNVGQVQIVRANMDGTNQTILGQNLSISAIENGLTIDYEEDRLFWLDINEKNVCSVDLDGLNVQTIDVSIVVKPTMINVYGNYIFVSNLTSIWRIDKRTGRNIVKVLPMFGYESQTIRGAKVFSRKSQIIDSNHPCADNNGGCKRYCIAKPKVNTKSSGIIELDRICKCNNNEKLDSDGKNCITFQ